MIHSMLSAFRPSSWRNHRGGGDAAAAEMEERAASLDPRTRDALADEIERVVGVGVGGAPPAAAAGAAGGATDATQTNAQAITTTAERDARTMGELDAALGESRESLVRLERRCDFVAERLDSYRRKLHQRRRVLMTTTAPAGAGGGSGGDGDGEGGDGHSPVSSAVEMGDAPGGGGDGGGGGGAESAASATRPFEGGPSVEEEEGRRLLPPSPSPPPTPEEIQRYHEMEANLEVVERLYRSLAVDVARVRERIDSMETKRGEILERQAECRQFVVAAALAEGRDRERDPEEEFHHPVGPDEEGGGGGLAA